MDMHFILIADIHLSNSSAESFGVDTVQNFERVIQLVQEHAPDHVVMMGDYSLKTPKREDVRTVCRSLFNAGVPYSFIAGNHDRAQDLAEACAGMKNLYGDELYFRSTIGDLTCLFLDTAKGSMLPAQHLWISEQLKSATAPTLVFMHHPPLPMGVPFMDNNHSYKDTNDALKEILFNHPSPLHIFSGHYHTARSAQIGIHSVHLCPSTYFQLDPSQQEFAVSHAMPGIRHVEFVDGIVRTWVEFLPKSES